jgi:thiol-disulfide isomerase/thioredoxin
MRLYALFAAFFLSATAAAAAQVVEVREPAKIATAFSPQASIRVVNVWATWCVPCVEEMADLRAIRSSFGPELSLIGVSLDDMLPGDRQISKKKVAAFLDQQRIAFPNVYYVGNSDALGEFLRFDGAIPITIAFDRGGRELWRQQGRLDRRKTINTIRKLLGRSR